MHSKNGEMQGPVPCCLLASRVGGLRPQRDMRKLSNPAHKAHGVQEVYRRCGNLSHEVQQEYCNPECEPLQQSNSLGELAGMTGISGAPPGSTPDSVFICSFVQEVVAVVEAAAASGLQDKELVDGACKELIGDGGELSPAQLMAASMAFAQIGHFSTDWKNTVSQQVCTSQPACPCCTPKKDIHVLPWPLQAVQAPVVSCWQ